MTEFEHRQETLNRVVALVAGDPDQLAHVISAAMEGQRLHTKRIEARLSAVDLVWRGLLALDSKRLTPALRDMIERTMMPVLEGDLALCNAELAMREKLRSRRADKDALASASARTVEQSAPQPENGGPK